MTLDGPPTPARPTWNTYAAYGDVEEPGGFSVEVSDRGPELIPWGNSSAVDIRAIDSTVNGSGYIHQEPTGLTSLRWKAADGRIFDLTGYITPAEAIRYAQSLERVPADDPRLDPGARK